LIVTLLSFLASKHDRFFPGFWTSVTLLLHGQILVYLLFLAPARSSNVALGNVAATRSSNFNPSIPWWSKIEDRRTSSHVTWIAICKCSTLEINSPISISFHEMAHLGSIISMPASWLPLRSSASWNALPKQRRWLAILMPSRPW